MDTLRKLTVALILTASLASCNRAQPDDPPTGSHTTITPPVPTETAQEVEAPTLALDDGPLFPDNDSITPLPPGDPLPAVARMRPGTALVIQTIEMMDREIGWAVGGAGGMMDSILRTEDGGLTWRDVSPPENLDPTVTMMAVGEFQHADQVYVVYHPRGDTQPGVGVELIVWGTSDGGDTWRASAPISVEFIGAEHAPAWLRMVSSGSGWLLARYGGSGMQRYPVYLLSTQDGALHWQIQEDPFEGRWLQSCPKTGWDWLLEGSGIITIGSCPFESAEIRLTSDAGQTWTDIRLPFPAGEEERLGSSSCSAHSPLMYSTTEFILASECPIWGDTPETVNLMYRTQDFGETWEINEYPGGVLSPLDHDTLLALGREISRSDDLGLTWKKVKSVAWDGQFSFVDAEYGWAVARDGAEIALVKTEDGGASWQIIEPALVP